MVKLTDKKPRELADAANPPKTEGLTPLDVDRAASVANEGGSSAATTEFQHPTPGPRAGEKKPAGDPGDCGCAGDSAAATRQYSRREAALGGRA
jgi:hypothetical protein